MGGTLDEFETKMHEAFYDDDNEFPHNEFVKQFLCLPKKEQSKFLDKYKKEETFVQLETNLSNNLYNGVAEEFVENHIKNLKSFYSNLLIISFLVAMFEIYNNPNYNEKLLNDFLNRFLRLTENEQKCFLAELGFEGESILKFELKNENQFLKLPESVKCKFICYTKNKFRSPEIERLEKKIEQKEMEIKQIEIEIEQKEIEFAEIEQKEEFEQREKEIRQLEETIRQLKEEITIEIERKKCILFNLASLSFLVKLKAKINKDNEKASNVEINENALMDFGGMALILGIILFISGLISTFLFPPVAWGLCLGLGTAFSTAGGFSIYKATEKNKSLNELSKNENVKDLHDKLNEIEEEDINENPNKSKKLNAGMSEIPLLANANVSQNQDKKYK